MKGLVKIASIFTSILVLALANIANAATQNFVEGIYLTQGTLENTARLHYLIDHAKAVGINTFVVDMELPSARYKENIQLLKDNHIRYVARIIVFPNGATSEEEVTSPIYWAKRYELIKHAIAYGAQEIQLDYIRYSSKRSANPQNAKDVVKVVQFFKERVEADNIPLEADVFAIASFGESKHIGQNLQMMAQSLDALCPMVYPSHFWPPLIHSEKPYQTIYTALKALQSQFNDKMPVKLYPYIEMYNFRYPAFGDQRLAYIATEIKAVHDAGADGWYAWSAHNDYDYLFNLLEAYQKQVPGNILQTVMNSKLPTSLYPETKKHKADQEEQSDNALNTDKTSSSDTKELASSSTQNADAVGGEQGAIDKAPQSSEKGQADNTSAANNSPSTPASNETSSAGAQAELSSFDSVSSKTDQADMSWPLNAMHFTY